MKRTRKPFFTLLALTLCTTLFLYSYYMQKNTPATQIVPENAADKNDTVDSVVIPETDPTQTILASTNAQQVTLSEQSITPALGTTDAYEKNSAIPLQESTQKNDIQTPSADTEIVTDNTKTRQIIIRNGITKKMLSYKHWTGKDTPSIFTIKVNDTPIVEGDELAVALDNNRFTVSYRYSFMNGYRIGARTITFIVNPESKAINLSFNWKNKWHVLCDQASPESVQEIEFKE
ncbi:MAG: hypothetical protein WCG04_07370 [Alphaproteobacteria bacterium]